MKKILASIMLVVLAMSAPVSVPKVEASVGNCEPGRPKARLWSGMDFQGKLLTACQGSINTLWEIPWNDGSCPADMFGRQMCTADQISSIILYGPNYDFCSGSDAATLKVYTGAYYSGQTKTFYAPKSQSRQFDILPYGFHDSIESLYIACGVHY